jgi:hypothetical protein
MIKGMPGLIVLLAVIAVALYFPYVTGAVAAMVLLALARRLPHTVAYGSLCVIKTLEFFQHHFAKSGHRDLLMTRQLISTNKQPLLRPPHAKRPPQSGFVQVR